MSDLLSTLRRRVELADGAWFLPGAIAESAPDLLAAINFVASVSPFRTLTTRRGGRLSAAMTSCGTHGWHSDRSGYRYLEGDPLTHGAWPDMPALLRDLAGRVAGEAGYPGFVPQIGLINRYAPGARMGLHQDRDEPDLSAPVVSFSLGLTARFLFGGLERDAPTTSVVLEHGDAVVWGGASRLAFHGVSTVRPGHHPLTGAFRYNLTFRII